MSSTERIFDAGLGATRRERRGVQAILCDLDGVIRAWDPEIIASAERLNGMPARALAGTAFSGPLLQSAITGVLTDCQWREEIEGRLREAYGPGAHRAVADWSVHVGDVNWEVVELLRRERRRGRRIALVSNATSRLERDLDQLGITQEFDFVFNSSRIGAAKPDHAIFLSACRALGVDPQDCAFVDDTFGHVQTAADLGLVAHHFRDVADLAGFLEALP